MDASVFKDEAGKRQVGALTRISSRPGACVSAGGKKYGLNLTTVCELEHKDDFIQMRCS